MFCKDCNTEMKIGYIQCRDGVYWDSYKHAIPSLIGLSSTSFKLSVDNTVSAYLCDKCKKVVIYYD